MSISYNVIARANPLKPNDPKKYYAAVISSGESTLRELATDIADISTVSSIDILAVLEGLLKVLPKHIANGKIVRFGDFGSFMLTIQSEGSEKPEEVSDSNIVGNKLNFRPGAEMKKVLNTVTYKKQPEPKAASSAKKK